MGIVPEDKFKERTRMKKKESNKKTFIISGVVIVGLVGLLFLGDYLTPDPVDLEAPVILAGATVESLRDVLTLDEFNQFIAMVNYEAEIQGGLTLHNVTEKNIFLRMETTILKRKETEPVAIDGRLWAAEDYEILRAELFEKINK